MGTVNLNTDPRNRVDVIYPGGKVDTWPANKDSLAMAIMLAGGVDNPNNAKGYAADVAGELFWGGKGEVTYDLPEGPTTFRFVPYIEPVDTVEISPRARINLALNKHWPWLCLAGMAVVAWIDCILGTAP